MKSSRVCKCGVGLSSPRNCGILGGLVGVGGSGMRRDGIHVGAVLVSLRGVFLVW